MTAVETPDFIAVSDRRLYCVRHIPSGGVRGRVVFCHPFGEEKKSSHRAFVDLARDLAEHGVASWRFDFTGCGDSSGDLRDATTEAWLEDLDATVTDTTSIAEEDSPLILVGLRLGAALAAEFAAGRPDIAGLMLWQPVVNGRKAFATDLRRTLIKQMITDGANGVTRDALLAKLEHGEGEIDLDGFPFTGALYRGIASVDLTAQQSPYQGRVAIVQMAHNDKLQPELHRLAEYYRTHGADVAVRTIVSPPMWARIERVECDELREVTLRWILGCCEVDT